MQNSLKIINRNPGTIEAAIWLLGLAYFAVATPQAHQHFTLCTFHWLGFTSCPGCGIGRSIGFFLHGDVASSWQMHILGIPATFLLLFRSFSLIHKNVKNQGKHKTT